MTIPQIHNIFQIMHIKIQQQINKYFKIMHIKIQQGREGKWGSTILQWL